MGQETPDLHDLCIQSYFTTSMIRIYSTTVLYDLDCIVSVAVEAILIKKHSGLGKGVVLTNCSEEFSRDQPLAVQVATNLTSPGVTKHTPNEKSL